MTSHFLNKLMLLKFYLNEIIEIKPNESKYIYYLDKIKVIKELLNSLKDIVEIKLNDDNLYILINSSYEIIPSYGIFKKICEDYFMTNNDGSIPNVPTRDNYLNLVDIIYTNFYNLNSHINNYINNIDCDNQLTRFKNLKDIMELKEIYKEVNKIFKLFNQKNNINNEDLTNNTNLLLMLFSQTHDMIIYNNLSKNEIYKFDLSKKSSYKNVDDLKLGLYKNILIKCKSIIDLSGNVFKLKKC